MAVEPYKDKLIRLKSRVLVKPHEPGTTARLSAVETVQKGCSGAPGLCQMDFKGPRLLSSQSCRRGPPPACLSRRQGGLKPSFLDTTNYAAGTRGCTRTISFETQYKISYSLRLHTEPVGATPRMSSFVGDELRSRTEESWPLARPVLPDACCDILLFSIRLGFRRSGADVRPEKCLYLRYPPTKSVTYLR